MGCTSWTHENGAAAPAADAGRRLSRLAGGAGSLIARLWRGYWDWRVKRTTVLLLHSLNRRTLRDIGIDRSEIESVVCDAGRDRRRRHDASRPWPGGGA